MASIHTARTAHWGILDANMKNSGSGVMGVTGIVTDFQVNMQAVTQNELNEVGSTISRVQYDERYDASCTMQIKSGPAETFIKKVLSGTDVKTTVSMGGRNNYVQSYDVIESNKNFVKIQFKLLSTRYLGVQGKGVQEQNEEQSK